MATAAQTSSPATPPAAASNWSTVVRKRAPPLAPTPAAAADRIIAGAGKSRQGIAVAVVDANAIIHGGDQLVSVADKVVSVAEVLAEVRDPVSRLRLSAVPFEVETMDPDPEALKNVISFARATGDLQTLSDVDLKLIALTYTLESQLHGAKHLRDNPPPLHVVNVKRLPEKDMPGWGSNVPNLAEWEALEHVDEMHLHSDSRILPLKDLNFNDDSLNSCAGSEVGSVNNHDDVHADSHENGLAFGGSESFPQKKETNIKAKMFVAEGIDSSHGADAENDNDWRPAVSRSTHRRYLRRQARRELAAASLRTDDLDEVDTNVIHTHNTLSENSLSDTLLSSIEIEKDTEAGKDGNYEPPQLKSESLTGYDEHQISSGEHEETRVDEYNAVESLSTDLNNLDIVSEGDFSIDQSVTDDGGSKQSWTIRSLSDSTVACVTSDFAMQNVILQIGLRLLAPGGMQIRQLHRWILKCHACNKVTPEIGRIFCPKCGNGGTLGKVSVTVNENGIILAARRPRINLRGTKFSLPMPQGGRDAITKNLILREDQLPHKILYPKTKKKPNKQDGEFFSSDDIFSHITNKRAALQPPLRKAVSVFSGRRNPNDNHYSRHKH